MKTRVCAQDRYCPADFREGIPHPAISKHLLGPDSSSNSLSPFSGPQEPLGKGRFLATLALAVVCGTLNLCAADSTFSLDNRFVYVAGEERPGLEQIDLIGKSRRTIDLSAHLNDPILAVSSDSSGLLACATARAIWLVDPVASTSKELVKVPEGYRLVDTACDPKTGEMLLLCRGDQESVQALFLLPKDGKVLMRIQNRYDSFVSYPVFSPDGALYFISGGDLWLGAVSKVEDDPQIPPYGCLEGTRCLPLADLVVGDHTPASTGLRPLGSGGDWMLAGYGRMGGTGWDSLIRFKRPIPTDPAVRETDPQRWQKLIAIIQSAEVLIEEFECRTICSSRDGRLVFMLRFVRDGGPDCFLSTDGGRPVALEIAAESGS